MSKKVKKRNKKRKSSKARSHRSHANRQQRRSTAMKLPDKSDGLYHIHSQSELNALLRSGRPTLVDFWAPWCMPCRRMGPIFAKIADRYGDRINFAKVDVQGLPQVGSRFGVRSIPTIIAFKGERVAQTEIGLMNEGKMRRFAEQFLPKEIPSSADKVNDEQKATERANSGELTSSPSDDSVKQSSTDTASSPEQPFDLDPGAEPNTPRAGLGGRIKRMFNRRRIQSSP